MGETSGRFRNGVLKLVGNKNREGKNIGLWK